MLGCIKEFIELALKCLVFNCCKVQLILKLLLGAPDKVLVIKVVL